MTKKYSDKEIKKFMRNTDEYSHVAESHISYGNILKDKLFIAKTVKSGLNQSVFSEIKNNSPFSDIEWASFLNINIRTLQRYRNKENFKFSNIQSERIFELAEVIEKAKNIFNTKEDFNMWLNIPNLSLGKFKPIDLLESSYGKDLILKELDNIEHGIFI